jgi:hypothetical protein
MTTHDRQLIDLSDLGVLRMECKCGSALVVPVEAQNEVPTRCGACNVEWLLHGSPQHKAFQGLLVRLKEARSFDASLPFRLRFETVSASSTR